MITHSIPDGKLYRALEMIDDPHFKALDTIIDIETGLLGWLEMRNDG